MTGNEAGKLKLSLSREAPDEFRGFLRCKPLGIRVVVFHLGIFPHRRGVPVVLRDRCQNEFVVEFAEIFQHKTNLLAATDLDMVMVENHFAVVVTHRDHHGAGRLFRIARLACGELRMAMAASMVVSMVVSRHPRTRKYGTREDREHA